MGLKAFTVAVASIGTPQKLSTLIAAQLPQISGALAGSAVLRGSVIGLQADPTNTATKNVYVGSANLNTGTRAGIGCALLPGVFAPSIYIDGANDIDDIWIDADTAATIRNLFVLVVG